MVWNLDDDCDRKESVVKVIDRVKFDEPIKTVIDNDVTVDESANFSGFECVGHTRNITINLPEIRSYSTKTLASGQIREGHHYIVSNFDKAGHKVFLKSTHANIEWWGMIDNNVVRSKSFTVPFGGWCRIDVVSDKFVVSASGNLNADTLYGNGHTTTEYCLIEVVEPLRSDVDSVVKLTQATRTTGYNPVQYDNESNRFTNISNHDVNLLVTFKIGLSVPKAPHADKDHYIKRVWVDVKGVKHGLTVTNAYENLVCNTVFIRLKSKDFFKLKVYQNSREPLDFNVNTCVEVTVI